MYTDPHQKKLLKKWGMILESGTPIRDERTKVVLAQILENTRNYYVQKGMLNEAGIAVTDIVGKNPISKTGSAGVLKGANGYAGAGTAANADYYLPNVVMPMLRRIMPDLIANDLVSVQPLNGPVGFALAYRPTYGVQGEFGKHPAQEAGYEEIGYSPVDTRWTGTSSDVISSGDYWDAYFGKDARWNGEAMDTPGAEYAALGDNYPTVSFGLLKSTVEARTRKLAAHWSPELAEDMQAMHGIDVEQEMVNTITYETGAEIDRQIVTEMVKAAIVGGSTSDWSPVSADGLDQMGRLATLLTQITVEAQNIAIRTKRGAANFVVTTPRICALLQQLGMNKFTTFKANGAIPTVPDTGVGALTKVGMINDDQQLLIRDAYSQSASSDYVLMGYKGKQVGDSGIIYCPYIPLQLQKVMQPGTFTYSIGARTRYGVMSNPWDAKNYYHFMKIGALDKGYVWGGDRHFIATPSKIRLDPTAPVPVIAD